MKMRLEAGLLRREGGFQTVQYDGVGTLEGGREHLGGTTMTYGDFLLLMVYG